VLARRGRLTVVEPFFERGSPLAVQALRDARPGQLVLASTGARARGGARVLKVLGRPEVAGAVLEAFMLHRGLARRFPPGVERAAEEAVERVSADDPGAPARRDLRSLPTFTIDPATARDFDDAVSAERLATGRWRVWVHIADVSAFVRSGSPVDREAYLRATSVYVPGRVEPMLPEVLSNGACSLVPGQDRLAVTVELELQGAEVVSERAYRSLIRSGMRWDYDRVDRFFAGEEQPEPDWAPSLEAAREAAAVLQERREAAGALAINSEEPEFEFSARGEVTDMRPSEQTESHRLIEHLMICANEAVARMVAARKVPALYRVHERPEAEAAERLLAQLASLRVPTPPAPDPIPPAQAAEVIAAASQLVAQESERRGGEGTAGLGSLVLRSLKQARYDPANLGHAGLHSQAYCHFTSPIRRYPDLICHRALLSSLGAGEDPPRGGGPLDEAATWTSARERDAMVIERKADDIARAFLLERRMHAGELPASFGDGEVVGLVGAGAFVRFGGGFEGFLPARRIGGDWWELNEEGTILQGAGTGRTLRIGQRLEVLVRRIEPPRGRVELDTVG
jgi:ribonuclease R